jgi:2-oxoisovalerate dehydrogenase E1 component
MLGRVTTPQNLDERFRDAVSAVEPPAARRSPDEPIRDGAVLTGARARQLFDAQLTSRHLDLAARWLRSFNEGFYTIGSSGHEGNAAVAAALRVDDPALLHYRSGAFYCARAASVDPDLAEAPRHELLGVVASANEPIAGGRQNVIGLADLQIIQPT